MYSYVLGLHNIVRWFALLTGIWSVFLVWRGWLQRRQWTDAEAKATRVFLAVLDFQFLIGLLLFAVFSPLTRQGFRDFGGAMSDAPVRYFLLEHPLIMLFAIACAHIGAVQVKRAPTDADRFQKASILYGLSVAALAGFIPWARPLFPGF
jgi:hypothetical protein